MATNGIEGRGALRPAEAARWMGCSRDTIDRLIAADALRSWKIGGARYISSRELERFVAERDGGATS